MKKRSKSGFTLVEMVIVLVIIGILASILIPTWNYFITRSKVTTQNNNARVVFNAAQTECIKYKFKIREIRGEITTLENQLPIQKQRLVDMQNEVLTQEPDEEDDDFQKRVAEHQKQKEDLEKGIEEMENTIREDRSSIYLAEYIEGGDFSEDIFQDFYYYWDGNKGYACNASLASVSKNAALDEAFGKAINSRIETPEDIVYKLHIKDYKVVSVICARHEKDRLVGSYPEQQEGRSSTKFKQFKFEDAERDEPQAPETTT